MYKVASNLLFVLTLSIGLTTAQTTIVIDGSTAGRTFDGIGALSAGASSRLLIDYPEPYRSQILDYLFKPGYGAALQHLKVEVGADVNSTDGSEPSHMRSRQDHDYNRGYEWWLMEEAHKRNPNIILDALPWGAPGWIGGGHFYSADMANYMADFIQGAKRIHGLDIRYAGIWNERPYDAVYVKLLHRTLLDRGLKTQIVCCDDYHVEKQFEVIAAMDKDPDLAAAVADVGVHYPRREDGSYSTPAEAKRSGRVLWSSEDQPNGGGGPFVSRAWEIGGRILAKIYNRNYLEGGFTKTEIWSPITSYYENLAAPHSGLMYANTPWSGYYEVQGTIWATAHTTQFAQPGWRFLNSASGFIDQRQGSYVALKSPHSGDWSFILETIDAHHPKQVSFQLKNGVSTGSVHVWQTKTGKMFEHVAEVVPKNSTFSFTFEPESLYSLTTTTGQGHGSAQPPPDKPFPLPYSDDFEQTTLNRAPKYLSDQDGAFEARPCEGRKGKCLEQVITTKPIPWGPLPNPFTLTGDSGWTDYFVSTDVRFTTANQVAILGRIDSADVFKKQEAIWPSGYILEIARDGSWTLLSGSLQQEPRKLASGTTRPFGSGWYKLALRFKGGDINASIDGKQIAAIQDTSHKAGMIGIGTDWGGAQFDDLRVMR